VELYFSVYDGVDMAVISSGAVSGSEGVVDSSIVAATSGLSM